MMIFIAKPDYEEYEMPDRAVIVADSEEEAIQIAQKEIETDPGIVGREAPQKWSVELISAKQKGVILQSICW